MVEKKFRNNELRLGIIIIVLALSACGGSAGQSAQSPNGVVPRGKGTTLTVPEGTFPEPMEAILTESDPNPAEFRSGQIPLSKQINLEFSSIQSAQNDEGMILEVPVQPPPSSSQDYTLYFLVKAEEGLNFGEFEGTHDWSFHLGTFDPESSTLTLHLFATARKFSVVAVAGPKISVHVGDTMDSAPSLGLAKQETLSDSPFRDTDFSKYRCAIFCDPSEWSGTENPCSADILRRISAECDQVTAGLAREGFDRAIWRKYSIKELKDAGYYPLIGSNASSETSKVNPIFVIPTPAVPSPQVVGKYDFEQRVIWMFTTEPQLTLEVMAHEICHGIQAFYNYATLDVIPQWMVESTAEFCSLFDQSPAARIQYRVRYRYNEVHRDFGYPLDTLEPGIDKATRLDLAYSSVEFWTHACQGQFSCLKEVFMGMKEARDSNSLAITEQILSRQGKNLESTYISLLQARNNDPNYPYCREEALGPTFMPHQPSDSVTYTTGPFSGTCRDFSLTTDLRHDACLRTTLQLEETANVLLLVDGKIFRPGEHLYFTNYSPKIWMVNLEMGRRENMTLYREWVSCFCEDGVLDEGEICDVCDPNCLVRN